MKQISAFQYFINVQSPSTRNLWYIIVNHLQMGKLIMKILQESAGVKTMKLPSTDFVHCVDRASVRPEAVMHGGKCDSGPMRMQSSQHHMSRVQSMNIIYNKHMTVLRLVYGQT